MWRRTADNFLITALLFIFSLVANAQPPAQTFNPYSRYGVGEIENKGFAQSAGMSRAVTAYENDERDTLNPVFINPTNPASYSSIRVTAFEVGAKSVFNFLEGGGVTRRDNNSYLSYLSLGFPLGKRTGFAVGLSPFSNVGYKISDKNELNGESITTEYEGTGGISQVFAGIGFRPFQNSYTRLLKSRLYDSLRRTGEWHQLRKKRFVKSMLSSISLGANGYFMFGDLNNTTSVIYPNTSDFSTRRVRNTRVSDFYVSYGANVSFRFDSIRNKRAEWKVTLGSSVYLPSNLKADYTALAYTYKQFGPNFPFHYDTTLNIQRSGDITMPMIISTGFAIRKGTKLTITGDVSIQGWSFYRYFGEDPRLKDNIRYSLGFQYVNNGEVKYLKDIYREKTMYRAGLYYQKGYLDLKGYELKEYGFSVGFGIPLGRTILYSANIGAELGTWGTTENNLIKSNFIRATIGLTLNQRWFQKRVID